MPNIINIEEDFSEKLKKIIRNKLDRKSSVLIHKDIKSIDDARTSISVSIKTRNTLRNLLKVNETYDDLIQKLIEKNMNLKEEIKEFQILLRDSSLIKFSETIRKRVHRTFMYHPDVKIEYSYTDIKKIKTEDNVSIDLNLDTIIYKGVEVNQKRGIKLMLAINILKKLSKLEISENISESIKKQETLLDNKFELLKTRYLIYFKILYLIINGKMKLKKMKDDNFLSKEFWQSIYYLHELPVSSFEMDILRKFSKLESETKQLVADNQKQVW